MVDELDVEEVGDVVEVVDDEPDEPLDVDVVDPPAVVVVVSAATDVYRSMAGGAGVAMPAVPTVLAKTAAHAPLPSMVDRRSFKKARST